MKYTQSVNVQQLSRDDAPVTKKSRKHSKNKYPKYKTMLEKPSRDSFEAQ